MARFDSQKGNQDIAIAKLRVRGDKRTAQILARELEQASWPLQLPSGLQNAWMMVRELRVSGKAQLLRQESAQQLEGLLARAVEGRNASNQAVAVRFTSLPELLAFLLRDLARGDAANKWYWQRWSGLFRASRDHAITQLLCENLAELPAVIEQLVAIGQLRLVWNAISSNSANTVTKQLARHYGISQSALTVNAYSSSEQQLQNSAARQFRQDFSLLNSWLAVLENLPTNDSRWQLAALISGLSRCPLLVMRSPVAVANAFIQQCAEIKPSAFLQKTPNQSATTKTQHTQENDSAIEPTTRTATSTPDSLTQKKFQQTETSTDIKNINSINNSNIKTNFSQLELGTVTANEYDATTSTKINLPQQSNAQKISADNKSQNENTFGQSVELENVHATNPNFITAFGGFFYLINAMRPFLTPDFLAAQSAATGWLWLFDCARLLAARAGIELDQSLLRFIARVAGFDDAASLCEASPSPAAQQLFAQLEQRFGEKYFWSIEKNLLVCSAQVIADASHIDVFYLLQSVRLDIRLAGLDVNPGWIPWLGRVVTFHYSESLHFGAQKNQGEQHAQ